MGSSGEHFQKISSSQLENPWSSKGGQTSNMRPQGEDIGFTATSLSCIPDEQHSSASTNLSPLHSSSPRPTAEAKACWAVLASLARISNEEQIEDKEVKRASSQERYALIKGAWSAEMKFVLSDLNSKG